MIEYLLKINYIQPFFSFAFSFSRCYPKKHRFSDLLFVSSNVLQLRLDLSQTCSRKYRNLSQSQQTKKRRDRDRDRDRKNWSRRTLVSIA